MNRRNVIAIGAVSCICTFQVLAVMHYLLQTGRLSIVPIYDDVVYLIDGLRRLDVLHQSGAGGFLADFYTHPAHAPFIALAATFGFLVSGAKVWGPYLINGIWVFIICCLALIAVRKLNARSQIGIVIAILAAPMFGMAVAEFRPDPVWGLLIGFSLAIMATSDLILTRPSRLFCLGLLFGTAIVAKPTAAPGSIVVLGIGFLIQIGSSLILQPNRSIRSALRPTGIVILGAMVLVVPYLVTNGLGIWTYIRTVMGTDNAVWRTRTTALGHITYYLNRGSGTLMLGWVWYLAAPLLITCAGVLAYAKDRRGLCALLGLLAACLAAYAIVTVSEVKSLMIGSILYGSIIGTMTWSLGRIAAHFPKLGSLVFAVGILLFALQWTPRTGMISRADPAMVATDLANKAAFPEVLQALRAGDAKRALITVPGPVYAGTMDFLARQQGVFRTVMAGYTWDTWEMFLQGVASSDVIVLSEAGMSGQALGFSFPSVQFQARLLTLLRSDPVFSGKPVLTDEAGRSVWVFVRN